MCKGKQLCINKSISFAAVLSLSMLLHEQNASSQTRVVLERSQVRANLIFTNKTDFCMSMNTSQAH